MTGQLERAPSVAFPLLYCLSLGYRKPDQTGRLERAGHFRVLIGGKQICMGNGSCYVSALQLTRQENNEALPKLSFVCYYRNTDGERG
jgi:hypothetical protein